MAISVMKEANMKGRMERDEDLTLFRELRKHQNERVSSLFHCVNSEEFECGTNTDSGRISSGKKEYGLEFLETNKNDYDWLKTPPATPLFPSLEMEPSSQLVVQKELPISQVISRFAWSTRDVEAQPKPKSIDGKATTKSTKAKLPTRSMTTSHNKQRPSIIKNTNELQQTSTTPPTIINNKGSNAKIKHDAANNTRSTPQKQTNNVDFHALSIQKSIETNESQRKSRSARVVSPSVKSRVVNLSNIVELSNETPPNLRTDQRSSSTTRGRSTTRSSTIAGFQNRDPTPRTCRPSRSPSPSMANGGLNQLDRTQKKLREQKETFTLAAGTNENRPHFKGSKMVEKVVNARKSGVNQMDRETKAKAFKYRV
ncbi:hypothetical protein HKD37_15G043815 [Glycine soja]